MSGCDVAHKAFRTRTRRHPRWRWLCGTGDVRTCTCSWPDVLATAELSRFIFHCLRIPRFKTRATTLTKRPSGERKSELRRQLPWTVQSPVMEYRSYPPPPPYHFTMQPLGGCMGKHAWKVGMSQIGSRDGSGGGGGLKKLRTDSGRSLEEECMVCFLSLPLCSWISTSLLGEVSFGVAKRSPFYFLPQI